MRPGFLPKEVRSEEREGRELSCRDVAFCFVFPVDVKYDAHSQSCMYLTITCHSDQGCYISRSTVFRCSSHIPIDYKDDLFCLQLQKMISWYFLTCDYTISSRKCFTVWFYWVVLCVKKCKQVREAERESEGSCGATSRPILFSIFHSKDGLHEQ